MRRCLSPNPKLVIVLAEYLALLLVQFAAEVITVIYMRLFGVQFGIKYPAILLVLFIACNIGIAGECCLVPGQNAHMEERLNCGSGQPDLLLWRI